MECIELCLLSVGVEWRYISLENVNITFSATASATTTRLQVLLPCELIIMMRIVLMLLQQILAMILNWVLSLVGEFTLRQLYYVIRKVEK